MLIRITDYCTMGCSHCMVNANENGTHMDMETFKVALGFTILCDMHFFISGGEPTSHPQFIEMLEFICNLNLPFFNVLIISNGMFLEDKKYADKILDFEIPIQITNDDRFYPKRVKVVKHPFLAYVDRITQVSPFGRAIKNKLEITQKYPACFNLRSIAQKSDTFRDIIMNLRSHALKFCKPSINVDGSLSAGENPSCQKIGTIYSTDKELVDNIRAMTCNACGLYKNLSDEYAEQWEEINNRKDTTDGNN
jgi:organic radical activating enzyme